MREILFRGKRIDNGEWVEGYYYKSKYYRSDNELTDYITIPHPETKNRGSEYFIIVPETIGQYTGITDKNGKKIFEGDIVANDKGDIGRVTWYEEHSAIMIYTITENKVYWFYDNDFSLIEVIGNIHDNPELLKGE